MWWQRTDGTKRAWLQAVRRYVANRQPQAVVPLQAALCSAKAAAAAVCCSYIVAIQALAGHRPDVCRELLSAAVTAPPAYCINKKSKNQNV